MQITEDKGLETENLVEQICERMFFSDFTVRSPKFRKSSGDEKEVADLLVLFGNRLLAIQVKTKKEITPASAKTITDFQRIERIVEKAIRQLKMTRRAIKNQRLSHFTTTRGYEIPFKTDSSTKVVGMVILDLIGEHIFPREDRTVIFSGYDFRFGMPVHIITREDFEVISTEIDTLPDFLDYLEARESIFSEGLLAPHTLELDLLALYKTQPELIVETVEKKAHLVIQEGMWDHYINEHRISIKKRDWLNRPSYLVDAVIEWIHSSVDYDLGMTIKGTGRPTFQGTVQGYLAVAIELARFRRLERRIIGERMLHCTQKADEIGHGHSLVISMEEETAVLVLATSKPRQLRLQALYNLSAMAYCAHDLKKIIGIATEPLSQDLRSYDVLSLHDVQFENHEQLKNMAKNAFGDARHRHVTEYGY